MTRGMLIGAALIGTLFLYWVLSTLVFAHLRFHTYHRRRRLSYPALGVGGWAAFYGRTVVSSLSLAWWWWRARGANGLRTPSDGAQQRPPVLCVHGFHLDGTSMWGIRQTLEAHGRATQAVTLGLPYRTPEVYSASLAQALTRLLAASRDRQVDVVAHSMGGLILRYTLSRSPELAAGVRRIVTLGSPHGGTGVLQWIRFGPVYRMMSAGSAFIRALATFESSAPGARVITVASRHDLIVYPFENAHLQGAEQVTVERIGHLGMLTSHLMRERVAQLLAAS